MASDSGSVRAAVGAPVGDPVGTYVGAPVRASFDAIVGASPFFLFSYFSESTMYIYNIHNIIN